MTKTIGLADDAYERLLAVKGENESFSDVVRRLTGAQALRALAGTMSPDVGRHYKAAIKRGRARADRERASRARRTW